VTDQYENATVLTRANVYFDGKCVSHTVLLEDGERVTLGVILPSTLRFATAAPETMEITSGSCRIRRDGASEWESYGAGESFHVEGDSAFDIEVAETLDYVCHYR